MSETITAPAAPVAPPSAPAPAPAAPAEGGTPAAQNTAEQAPATAPEGEQPDTGQDPEKRGKSRYERRLDKAYRRIGAAEERAAVLEKELTQFRERQKQAQVDPAAPKLEQFKDIEEYATAKANYEKDKALRAHQATQQSDAQKQAQARLAETWEVSAERGEGKYDDFNEVVGEIKPSSPWAMALMHAENGDDIAYHLGKNIKEAMRINSLPPVNQIYEIGRLGAKLAAEPPKPKTPSKAPAPITPVSGTASAASPSPSENDDMKTWMAKRQKQVHGPRK